MSTLVRVSEEARSAIAAGRPVVALESTVITHGLPAPANLALARSMEAIVRAGGGTPATVAVLEGEPRVGVTDAELARIAASDAMKLSTRDLPVAAARRADGGTTVAATMWLARAAGVEVFATGGIGGVHRGPLPDVSADIAELGRTPMIVVCAGAKSVLDLPATREALESAGVLILGWRTEELPGFYTRSSGLRVDAAVDGASEVAEIWRAARRMGTPGAILVCVPPPESAALDPDEIDAVIARAIENASAAGVTGTEVTPHLLNAIATATGGRSIATNIALLEQNAGVAAAIAGEVAKR